MAADRRPRAAITWIGSPGDLELDIARLRAGEQAAVTLLPTVSAAVAAAAVSPTAAPQLVVLAHDRPDRFDLRDAVALSRCWPLAAVVSVASSLVEGRRRSGPPLPGIEEVPWHDFPGRLACWLVGLAHGRPGTLGPPAPLRREDRLLVGSRRVTTPGGPRPAVAVAAARTEEVDGVAALLNAVGSPPTQRTIGRPDLSSAADVVVWDLPAPLPADIGWLRLLTANRPDRRVILLVSFPRGPAVAEALVAGAAAVLGRPTSLEALAGTLLLVRNGVGTDLSPVAGGR